ncbi:PAS domain S-box-containing protein [Novosphingobium sp. SG751A]|uniref:PAS domain S-box protein n=1 Tax=Novosphingobium sp. SG751A TaxID=2587000 RepID=UPI0015566029|nr:PAS domain S-box protein [Novosphingobium sp. SG751A]NOW48970.1 PAS domain S-box-containing protein [Novosphingobium sp. SG751A]
MDEILRVKVKDRPVRTFAEAEPMPPLDHSDALADSAELFRETFERANIGMAHVSLDGSFLRANRSLCRLLGRDQAELACIRFQDITHPDDLDTDMHLLREVLAGIRETYTMEKRYIRPDGTIIWADLSVSLLRDAQGHPINFISVVNDIHARKQAQELVQLVLSEANHRVKNLLSVVSAIVTSSARGADSAQELEAAISGRLRAMAASHDLLTGKSENGGQLTQLVRRQLEIFTDLAVARIKIEGPDIQLTPAATHAFGMVLHELSTNACKYGALSNETGSVLISWWIDPSAQTLHFDWHESGGPPVRTPQRQGFGSLALQRMLSGSLGGRSSYLLAKPGARFEAVVPAEGVVTLCPN